MNESVSKANKTIPVYVNPDLIFAVKEKADREVSGMSASGVVTWLCRKYLNPGEKS
jgi:hypothetical protein